MDGGGGPARWQYCRIERSMDRSLRPRRERRGAFVVLVPEGDGFRCISRSAPFALSSPTDEGGRAFRALLADLAEEGWRPWRGPEAPIGFDALNRGYWSVALRRPVVQERRASDPALEALRERAIERLRDRRDRATGRG